MKRALLLLCVNLASLHPAFAAPAAPSTTALVSVSSQPGLTSGGGSFQPVLTADGRFIAFVSTAKNLVTNSSRSPWLNLFLRDRISGRLAQISSTPDGLQSGDGDSVGPALSGNGRFVAFQSSASNLATNDANDASDVFLRDLDSGATLLVSRELTGGTARGLASTTPLLSTDGRWLVFESSATQLVANDTNAATDILVFDRQAGTNALVSVNEEGNGSRAGTSLSASMTPDGRLVAFVNWTSNGSPTLPAHSDVYLRDLQAGTTRWVSSNAATELSLYVGAKSPVLSADGSAVFFHAFNPTSTNLYRFDVSSGASTRIGLAQGLSDPSPSADGRSVAYESSGLVQVWDLQTGTNILASVDRFGQPAPSRELPCRPILSAEGTKVTFLSNAADLTEAGTNGFAQLYQRNVVAGTTVLVNADTNGAASGDLSAVVPAITADGSVVAFESASSTMVAEDLNGDSDVFVREVGAGVTSLISRREASLPASTSPATATLYPQAVSANGRFVTFASRDRSDVPGDTNGMQDIFMRDLVTGGVIPISDAVDGTFTNRFPSQSCVLSADGRRIVYVVAHQDLIGLAWSTILWRDRAAGETRTVIGPFTNFNYVLSTAPTLSADGRWVAFQTTEQASLLEPALIDPNGAADIILQDVLAGTNTVVSRSRFGTYTGNGASSAPLFSPDGRWLAFASTSSDLTTQAAGGLRLFVRDLAGQTIFDVSSGLVGLPPNYAGHATFSSDSRFLAYNASGSHVGLYDLTSHTLSNVCSACANPTLSGDGRLLAVESLSVAGNNSKVQLLDRLLGRSTFIGTDANNGTLPADATYNPVLSADGRYLVFLAAPSFDTVSARTPRPVLYLRDLDRGLTVPVPVHSNGGSGNGASYLPQLAADSRTLVFASYANDIVNGDFNERRDVFTVKIGSPDTDADGLDDDWELAYFGDLSRDGNGDFDQDGVSDRDEFRSGTDPTNKGSVLQAVVFASVPANEATIVWQSVPGRAYDVQYKDDLADNWLTLFAAVPATSTTHSVVDNLLPRPSHRFYRVVFVP